MLDKIRVTALFLLYLCISTTSSAGGSNGSGGDGDITKNSYHADSSEFSQN